SAIGVVIGVIAALMLTRLMTTMLVGVKSTDPLTFMAMMLLFFAITTASSWIPASRAAGVDPNKALREERLFCDRAGPQTKLWPSYELPITGQVPSNAPVDLKRLRVPQRKNKGLLETMATTSLRPVSGIPILRN